MHGASWGMGIDKCNQGYYGRGLYLAEKAQYSSNHYAYTSTSVGTRKLILCRAAIGIPHDLGTETSPNLVAPPKTNAINALGESVTVDATCVQGGPHAGSIMYVHYSHGLAYPEYLVEFRA